MTAATLKQPNFDRWLLVPAILLVLTGLLMVASSSIVISLQHFGVSFHYLTRQALFLALGASLGLLILKIDTSQWFKLSGYLILASFALLILVLLPGVGRTVNGSTRWLSLLGFGFQVSECVKLFSVMYLAAYLVKHQQEVIERMSGFVRPMILMGLLAFLLLLQPDFGAAVVILFTALGLLFLAGARLWQFLVLLALVALAVAALAFSSPYRLARLTTFLNPWANQFDSGYQLTQSLIAFGRGGWFGVGLGESVQKLFYLPEAHTDFIFAVLAEELGLVGALTVLALYTLFIVRAFMLGRRCQQRGMAYAGYLATGLGLWLGAQVVINIGVNVGALPTKGLTLPLMSYGGSSILVNCLVVALLLRIDYESKAPKLGTIKHDN